MKTLKMSLANIQGKLSRAEMRKVMAGSGSQNACVATADVKVTAICYPDQDSAQAVGGGTNGWWACNNAEAHEICGY